MNVIASRFTIDEKLTATLEGLSEREATEKLHKTMLIFNDRNPIYILNE